MIWERPPYWARACHVPGVPNLWRVSPTLYRSAQPTAEGIRNLISEGFSLVISLRAFHKDPIVPGIRQEQIWCKPWHPEKEDVLDFLMLTTEGKALVHCQHGADRTGTMVAIYRVYRQDWSADEAIEEMVRGGFGFHPIWTRLPQFVKKVTKELRR